MGSAITIVGNFPPTGTTVSTFGPIFSKTPTKCQLCKQWFYRGNITCSVAHAPGQCCHIHDQLIEPQPTWLEALIMALRS